VNSADADRGDDLVAIADHRRGHGAHAEFGLFVADAEAARRHSDQIALREKNPVRKELSDGAEHSWSKTRKTAQYQAR